MVLEISDVSFSYGGTPVLDSISFSVNSGEQWMIIGKNGCGKSTLLRCIAGLQNPSSGQIKVAGRIIDEIPVRERARFISYVPQFTDRNLPFTVYDYVMMSRYSYRAPVSNPAKTNKEIIEESLVITETMKFRDRPMTTLSGGEQQRVFLAGAVAQQTAIIILDEPTTFLDPSQVQKISFALKKTMERYNTAIITVSHELNNSIYSNSKVLAIKNGKSYFTGPINELMKNDLSIITGVFEVPFEKVHLSSGMPFILPRIDSTGK
jgi:iron complex transport system ATP-binding protein